MANHEIHIAGDIDQDQFCACTPITCKDADTGEKIKRVIQLDKPYFDAVGVEFLPTTMDNVQKALEFYLNEEAGLDKDGKMLTKKDALIAEIPKGDPNQKYKDVPLKKKKIKDVNKKLNL